jgi:hypothetical protein
MYMSYSFFTKYFELVYSCFGTALENNHAVSYNLFSFLKPQIFKWTAVNCLHNTTENAKWRPNYFCKIPCTFTWYRIIKQIKKVKWIRHENKLQLFRLIGTRPCALLTALRKRAKWRQRSSFGQSLQSLQMTTISGQKSESFYFPHPFSIFFSLASKSSFVVIFVAPLRALTIKIMSVIY